MTTSVQAIEEALQQQISDGTLDLPILPAVANQVIQLTSDPESTSKELADLLQRDQALASHAMRIANSAAYSPVTKLVSLQQVITRLGMRTLSEIALSSTLGAKLFKVPGYEWRAVEIWRHALATALWCKEISRINRRNVDTTFLAGLLHSIGRPVVLQASLKLAQEQGIELSKEQVSDLEDRFQQEVGLTVCQMWNMPALVIDTVQHLQNPQQAEEGSEQIAIVQGATCFAQHTLVPDLLDEEQLRQLDIIEHLHLYDDDVDQLLSVKESIESTLEAIAR